MGDPHPLGLPAVDRAVEAGVAEEARALALIDILRRLALGEEAAFAHPAVSAGDVEGDDDAIADGEVRDCGPTSSTIPMNSVTEDVAFGQVRGEDAAGGGPSRRCRRRDAHDGVCGSLDPRVGHLRDADVLDPKVSAFIDRPYAAGPGRGTALGVGCPEVEG